MKQTVIQCITALICVIAISITGMSCFNKVTEASIQSAKSAAEAAGNRGTSDGTSSDNQGSVPSQDSSTSTDTPASDTTTDAAAADTSSADSSSSSSSAASPAGNSAPKDSTPTSKSDIVKYYNTAVNKVISSKAGYSKKRTTNLSELKGAEAIMKISVARDAVYSFLGVGDLNYTNKKGETKFMSQASLTDADVTDAKCVNNNGIYTITLTLANGKSEAPANTDTSPLKRSGLHVGNDDKSEYDYKNAQNIYLGLKNSDDTDIGAVSEETKNTKITAVIDSKTGNLTGLTVSFDWTAALTDVKYTIIKISGTGVADTKVVFSGFQW